MPLQQGKHIAHVWCTHTVSTNTKYPVIINYYSILIPPMENCHSHLRAIIKLKRKYLVIHLTNPPIFDLCSNLRVAIWFHRSSWLKKTQLPASNDSPKQHTCSIIVLKKFWKQKAFLWFQKNKNTKLHVDGTNTNRNKEKHWITIFIK